MQNYLKFRIKEIDCSLLNVFIFKFNQTNFLKVKIVTLKIYILKKQ